MCDHCNKCVEACPANALNDLGSYDDEPATIATLERFILDNGYANDISGNRRHHEIYLSAPRKTAPEKLKTVIRHPIIKRSERHDRACPGIAEQA